MVDGDEEDLDETEVLEAIALHAEACAKFAASAKAKRMAERKSIASGSDRFPLFASGSPPPATKRKREEEADDRKATTDKKPKAAPRDSLLHESSVEEWLSGPLRFLSWHLPLTPLGRAGLAPEGAGPSVHGKAFVEQGFDDMKFLCEREMSDEALALCPPPSDTAARHMPDRVRRFGGSPPGRVDRGPAVCGDQAIARGLQDEALQANDAHPGPRLH
jgi:hypothetical protein